MFAINPKTNRKIIIGKGTWNTLTEEEKKEGVRLIQKRESKIKDRSAVEEYEDTKCETIIEYVINPRTNRKIQKGKKVWNSLTKEEQRRAVPYTKSDTRKSDTRKTDTRKTDTRKSDTRKTCEETNTVMGDCNICLEKVKVLESITSCCKQVLCKSCYIKSASYLCPYCRHSNPYTLNKIDMNKKKSINARYKRDEIKSYETEYYEQHIHIPLNVRYILNPYQYGIDVVNRMLAGDDIIQTGNVTLARHHLWNEHVNMYYYYIF